jgi:hypothetical protein
LPFEGGWFVEGGSEGRSEKAAISGGFEGRSGKAVIVVADEATGVATTQSSAAFIVDAIA